MCTSNYEYKEHWLPVASPWSTSSYVTCPPGPVSLSAAVIFTTLVWGSTFSSTTAEYWLEVNTGGLSLTS